MFSKEIRHEVIHEAGGRAFGPKNCGKDPVSGAFGGIGQNQGQNNFFLELAMSLPFAFQRRISMVCTLHVTTGGGVIPFE